MRLSVQEDIGLSPDAAFRYVIDLEFLGRHLLRRGVDIVRCDTLSVEGGGVAWKAEVPFSGSRRAAEGRITRWTPPEAVILQVVSGSLVAEIAAEFSALSDSSTRLRITLDMSAQRFRDRMLVNSLKMTKTLLSGRFSELVFQYVRDAERRAAQDQATSATSSSASMRSDSMRAVTAPDRAK